MPSAVTTFLFTDIEGSTQLWENEPERMHEALARHDALTRSAIETHRGTIVKTSGDGAHAAFRDPLDAMTAAVDLQLALAEPAATNGIALRVRCGIHVGIDEQRDNDFFGRSVNRAALIMGAAHGGQILVSDAAANLVGDRLPADLTLRELGCVRLRGFLDSAPLYQVVHPALRADFPALRSLQATPNNLPLQVSSFVGRERELAEVKRLMQETRLLTLVGPGGIGKTRLCLKLASDLRDEYADGVWFVDLAPLTDSRVLPNALASVLGIKEDAGRPVMDAVVRFVKTRALLIVLDGCEHVLGACSALVTQLVQSGVRLRIVASSRQSLHLAGERTYPVPSLSTPSADMSVTPETLLQSEAARLFVERASAVQPKLELTQQNAPAIAQICRRLDGIPLAMELAAVRARVLPIEKIAERLNDRFRLLTRGDRTALPRQQTLRASFDWSYELLTPHERALLRRLAVFAGGWALEAAEIVGASEDAGAPHVLDLLTELVEKSLVSVNVDRTRYRLLETVREYAQERLEEEGGEPAIRARHLAYYLSLAEDGVPLNDRPRQRSWFARLDAEWENLLAALESCAVVDGGAQAALRLVYAIKHWLVARGLLGLGYRVAMEAVARAGSHARDAARCRALCAAGELGFLIGDYAAAHTLIEESLAIAQEHDDRGRVAEARRLLGYVALAHDDSTLARDCFETALELSRKLDDKSQLAAALNGLAELHRTEREPHRARPLYEEAVALDREVGDRRRLAVHLCNLAGVLLESGSEHMRSEVLVEALDIAEEIGSKQVSRAVLEYAAALGALHDEWALGARLYAAAQGEAERMGYHREPMDQGFLPQLMQRARAVLGDAAFGSAEHEGRALAFDRAVAEARAWLDRAHRMERSLANRRS